MQAKLMKYEWKAYQKALWLIIGIITLVTLASCVMLTLFPLNETNEETSFISALTVFGSFAVYYIVAVGCGLATTLLIAIRYYKSMYSDQAYLTHTLPVGKNELLRSKIIIASVFTFLSSIFILISVIVIIPVFAFSIAEPINRQEFWSEVMHAYGANSLSPTQMLLLFGVLYLLMLIIGSFSSTVTVFTSITLGQLFTKHRIIGAILCYFGVTALQSTISMIGYLPFYIKTIFSAANESEPSMISMLGMVAVPSVLIFVTAVIMFIICRKQLNQNLNLE